MLQLLLLLGLSASIVAAEKESTISTVSMETNTSLHLDEKRGKLVHPPLCESTSTCLYKVEWELDTTEDVIKYKIEAKQNRDTWTGLGFTDNPELTNRVDFIYGYVSDRFKATRPVIIDGWTDNRESKIETDLSQDVLDPMNVEYVGINGLLMWFSRKRHLSDPKDLSFTDVECHYLVLPIGGGKLFPKEESDKKLGDKAVVSNEKICIRAKEESTMSTVSMETVTNLLGVTKPSVHDSTTTFGRPIGVDDMRSSKLPESSTTMSYDEDYTKTTSSHLTTKLPIGIDDIVYKRICYYSYLAQYREGNAKCLPEDLNPALCTHLVLAYANLTTDHKLIPMEPSDITPDGLYKRFNNLKTKSDVKTLLAVGGKDLGTNAVTQMLLTPETRLTCINSAIALLRENGFDGLSVDFEYPGSQDKPHYTNFLKELNEAFVSEAQTSGKKKLILTATVAGLTDIIEKGYEADKIHEYLEFINVMTYNLLNESDKVTEHHSTVYPSHNSPNDEKNMVFVANYWVKKGVPKKKLVVGISAAARGFKLADPNIHGIGAPVVGPSPPGECTKEEGILSYYEICMLLNDTLTTTVELIDEKVSYLYTNNTWMGYDNPKSLETKVNVLKSEGYAGWMVSMADLDDFKGEYCNQGIYPLISILSRTLIGSVTGTLPPLSKILESTKSLVHTRETMTTIGHMSTLPDVCKVGVEDGLYPHPTDCKMYVRCTGGQETFLICLPEKPYYEPSIRDCTTQGYLSAERKKECNVD